MTDPRSGPAADLQGMSEALAEGEHNKAGPRPAAADPPGIIGEAAQQGTIGPGGEDWARTIDEANARSATETPTPPTGEIVYPTGVISRAWTALGDFLEWMPDGLPRRPKVPEGYAERLARADAARVPPGVHEYRLGWEDHKHGRPHRPDYMVAIKPAADRSPASGERSPVSKKSPPVGSDSEKPPNTQVQAAHQPTPTPRAGGIVYPPGVLCLVNALNQYRRFCQCHDDDRELCAFCMQADAAIDLAENPHADPVRSTPSPEAKARKQYELGRAVGVFEGREAAKREAVDDQPERAQVASDSEKPTAAEVSDE